MAAKRLSDATLGALAGDVAAPGYRRDSTRIGVVHFGPGAFHRAHQAFFFDRMLAADPGLAISAISLRSDAVRQALEPQDGLYSLVEREAEPAIRVIGSIREVLTAPRDPAAVLARLADPAVRYVTATVTEKGYCLDAGGELDLDHPDIRRDLAAPDAPVSFIGWLAAGLKRRHAAGVAPPMVLSCDNLSGNGRKLRAAVVAFARAAGEAEAAAWIEGEVRFPDSMVDAITPATDAALRAEAARRLGLEDAWPIQRERFCQWVVEDNLGADAETFAAAGVTLTNDVAGFERAKLRLLNGAHSTLAYIGLALCHATVAEAMADVSLNMFIEKLMRQDVAPLVGEVPGLDVQAYVGQVLARFANPAIEHRLSQIAWDGSQKLPIRLISTIGQALAAGRPIGRLAVGVAAWIAFIRRQTLRKVAIVDPLAETLAELGGADGTPSEVVARFLRLRHVFPAGLAEDIRFGAAVEAAYAALISGEPRRTLAI